MFKDMKKRRKQSVTCSGVEDVCPYCGSKGQHEEHDSFMLECAAYRLKNCGNCGKRFANSYLLTFDEDRPEDDRTLTY